MQYYEPVDDLGLYGLDPPTGTSAPFCSGVKRYIATGDSGQGMTGMSVCLSVCMSGCMTGACVPAC